MSHSKIVAARLEDMPSVMTAEQVREVTLLGEHQLREIIADGNLSPLAYSRSRRLFWRPEVERFLAASTGVTIVGDPYARILELERRLSECAP